MYCVGAVCDGLPKLFGIIASQAFYVGAGNDRSRVVPNHAVPVTGAGPFGQETALQPGIHQAFLHLGFLVGVDQVQQGEQAPESIPETGVAEQITLAYLSVERTVMDPLALGVDFGEVAGEEHGPVEAGIECPEVVDVVVFDLDPSQYLVPACAAGFLDVVERLGFKFPEIDFRLIGTDERRCYSEVYLLAFGRLETNHGILSVNDCRLERRVADHYEPVVEILGDSAVVGGRISNDGIPLLVDLYEAPLVCVHDEI